LIGFAAVMARRLVLRLKRRHGRAATAAPLFLAHRSLHREGRRSRPFSTTFFRLELHPSLHLTLAAAPDRPADRPTGAAALGRLGSPGELQVVERSRQLVREIVRHRRRSEGGGPRPAPLRHVPPPAWLQPPPIVILRQPAERPRDVPEAGPSGAGLTIAAPVIRPVAMASAEAAGAPLGRAQIERLTEEVMKGIDRRFVALRERMGRG
jgi:hypothetical protein